MDQVAVSSNWDRSEMSSVYSFASQRNCRSHKLYSFSLQHSYSWTAGSNWRHRCHWRVAVWVALATLLGCCVVTDTSSVLASDDDVRQPTGARLATRSLPNVEEHNNDELLVDNDRTDDNNDDDDYRNLPRISRSNVRPAKTFNARARNTAVRTRRRRRRKFITTSFLLCFEPG